MDAPGCSFITSASRSQTRIKSKSPPYIKMIDTM
jgi:hypothetical protein